MDRTIQLKKEKISQNQEYRSNCSSNVNFVDDLLLHFAIKDLAVLY